MSLDQNLLQEAEIRNKKVTDPPLRRIGCFLSYEKFPYLAEPPREASIRKRRLYFATRSPRQGAPVLMNLELVATEMSERVVSSVSPDR